MRVLVLTGDHKRPDSTKLDGVYSAQDLHYHQRMREAWLSLPGDYEFTFLSSHDDLLPCLQTQPPDLAVNFCDTGFRNNPNHELHIPALLELFGIGYTGAPPACMALCYDKSLVRLAAHSIGVAVPWEYLLKPDDPLDMLEDLSYPAFIKPNRADGSVGITRDALAADARAARGQIEALRRLLPVGDLLIQEYLNGPEYGLALIGNPASGFTALPPLTVDYSSLPKGLPPILAYESKNDPDSPYWNHIVVRAAELPDLQTDQLRATAERLFARLSCQDYARFDFRTGRDGVIKLMEVNPNPAWDPEAKLALMGGFAGHSYPETLELILRAAARRLGLLH